MSQYITIQGEITYKTKEQLDAAVQVLEKGGWVKDGLFYDESDDVMNSSSDPSVRDIQGLIISFPWGIYRNIGHVLDQLVKGCSSSHIVWTCTDGCFIGGVFNGEKETTYDLEEYASKDDELGKPPVESDDDFQEYCDWQMEVENAFHAEFF